MIKEIIQILVGEGLEDQTKMVLQDMDPWIRERKQCHQCTEMIINVQCNGMLNFGFIRIFVLFSFKGESDEW